MTISSWEVQRREDDSHPGAKFSPVATCWLVYNGKIKSFSPGIDFKLSFWYHSIALEFLYRMI